ncbi:MAG: transcriptional regulator [Polaromonas sp.]|nr:transcriptional regulator [Polaromonas sp.]
MLTIIETPNFQRMVTAVWSEAEREEFVSFISENAQAGDVIPNSGGLRKVRWARPGMGKQGGARVIYFTRLASGEVVLIAVYVKAKFDNMPVAVLKSWKEAYDA